MLTTTQKEIYVRRGLIEGAVSTNANNSTTKSRILKSPFRGGRLPKKSSQSEIMVAGKFLVVLSGNIFKILNRSVVCCEDREFFAQLMTSLGPRFLSHVFPDVGPIFTRSHA